MDLPHYPGPRMVELITGDLVFNDSSEWRDECLARFILAMPSLETRRVWLFDLENKRGPETVAKIKATMTAIHEASK